MITSPSQVLGLYALTVSAAAVDIFILQQVFIGEHSVQESIPSWSIHKHMRKLFPIHPGNVTDCYTPLCCFPSIRMVEFLLENQSLRPLGSEGLIHFFFLTSVHSRHHEISLNSSDFDPEALY